MCLKLVISLILGPYSSIPIFVFGCRTEDASKRKGDDFSRLNDSSLIVEVY